MDKQKTIWLLSEKGILALNGDPVPNVPFQDMPVNAGDVKRGRSAVIVNEHEIWTVSAGRWDKLVSTTVTLNCICYTAHGDLLVGTEGARLARVKEGGLEFIKSFDEVPERSFWNTPWGGPPDVRSLAVSIDGTIYANVHVGWIVRSMDRGKTWKNLKEGLDMDVHQVAAHPVEPTIVSAATANGFYISYNYGDVFFQRNKGLPYYYQRACACFADRNVYLVSTSRGPHGQADALLYRSEDDGKNWTMVNGLPEKIDKNIDTFQIAIVDNATAMAIVEDKNLYKTNDWGLNWHKVEDDYPVLFAILLIEGLS